jgi:hypothetical protein
MPIASRLLIVLGVVLLGISILADPVGLGRYPGFGRGQIAGAVVALLILAAGFVMRTRHGEDGGAEGASMKGDRERRSGRDRRSGHDRRSGDDRRKKQETPRVPDKRKGERRRGEREK